MIAVNRQLRRDPTQTITLRTQYRRDMVARFRVVKRLIMISIASNDALRLKSTRLRAQAVEPLRLGDLDARDRVSDFVSWVQRAMTSSVMGGASQWASGHWQDSYIRRAFKLGIERADKEMVSAGVILPIDVERLPIRIESQSLNFLLEQNFEALDGVTQETARQIQRELRSGLLAGDGPRVMARRLANRVDAIGINRANHIARTEIVRAYNEAALDRYEQIGIKQVAALVEFSTAGDERVCQQCQDLEREGRKYTIEQARGVIPVHPSCRCFWLPIV